MDAASVCIHREQPDNYVNPTGHRPIKGDDPYDEIWTKEKGEWKYLGSRKAERLKKNPKPLEESTDLETLYAGESDLSVIARLLYSEDPKSTEAHLWVLENRRISNEGGTYFTGGATYRGLALGKSQFSGMYHEKAYDPAAYMAESNLPEAEQADWEKCVDAAFKLLDEGIGAIPKPSSDFTYGWTQSYTDEFAKEHKPGKKVGGTWFYHRPDDPYR